jgi:acyl transferase domain-containing protein
VSEEHKAVEYLRRVVAELRTARERLRNLEEDLRAPIAIVGFGCRYPGDVDSPDALWDLVAAGRDAIGLFPADRDWDSGPYLVRRGGFISHAADFDAGFFEISPREALAMDPQQRLALEVTWEALEHAGIDPHTLRGSDTAVFTGASQQQYGSALHESPDEVAGHRLTGTANSVVSGRVAYLLGLSGPAMTVDTACSSSLVAIHLACQALRDRECGLALAGGVTVMATPGTIAEFGRLGGLAADGRCKAFAAAADGIGLAEGAGVLVLERQEDAHRHGHRVWAVLRGSAINQDGASNGLSAPSGPAQQWVIEKALANARIDAADIDAVEAHGTGTALGDPVEANAIMATYGGCRAARRPLWLGSLKSNIGHAQAAGGVGSVIKMVLGMSHGVLPPTLHAQVATPHVDWSSGAVRLLTAARPWPAGAGRPRRAAVSSFGISGTNAHLIVEQAADQDTADQDTAEPAESPRPVWLLSGRSAQALRAQAVRLGRRVRDRPELSVPDLAHSLAVTRACWEHRAALLGAGRTELLDQLDALAALREHPGLVTGVARAGALAFLFSGQGGQRAGMGAQAYAAFPAFALALDEACAELDPLLGRSLRQAIFAAPDPGALDRTDLAQPALFAVQVALSRLLESWGLAPDVVLGHSVGEVAAAHVAGILSLPDAAALVAARGRLMQALPGSGAMVAVQAGESAVLPLLNGTSETVSLAALNGTRAVVLSGHEEAVLSIAALLREQGHATWRLRTSRAFHSPLMQPILEQLRAVAEKLTYRPARIPVVSTLTGLTGGLDSADYWARQAREPVNFARALHTLTGDRGADRLVELGPDATLTKQARVAVPDATVLLATLRRGRPEPETLVELAAQLHVTGTSPRWAGILPGRAVALPTYPFQRQRYWLGPAASALCLAEMVSVRRQPWLADHTVHGATLLPGTAFVELALRAGRAAGRPYVGELVLHTPLDLSNGAEAELRATVTSGDADHRPLRIESRPAGGAEWTCHATGTLGRVPPAGPAPPGWSAGDAVDITDHQQRCERRGLRYGPALRGLAGVWRDGPDLLAEAVPPAGLAVSSTADFHPAVLDAALQALLIDTDGAAALPFSWTGVCRHRPVTGRLRARITPLGTRGVAVAVFDEQGQLALSIDSLLLRPAPAALLQLEWAPMEWVPNGASREPGGVALIGAPSPAIRSARRHPTLGAFLGSLGESAPPATIAVCPPSPANDTPDLPAAVHIALRDALRTLSALLTHPELTRSHLTLLTRDATSDNPNLAAATIRALWRTAATEHPHRITLLDTDATDAALDVLLTTREPDVAVRNGIPHVSRLVPVRGRLAGVRFDPDTTVLITGGTGALGAQLARHMVARHGVRHLILTSRRGLDAPGARQLQGELGVTVTANDLSDPAQVAALLASIPPERPLSAIVHAAGAVRDAPVTSLTAQQLTTVLRPKIDAAWQLHQHTRHLDLTVFCLCSSLAGTIGTAGQGNYAAANAFLDALARHRARAGLAATAIVWGWWDQTGMTERLTGNDRRRLREFGLTPMSVAEGLTLFDAGLRAAEPVVVAARLQSDKITWPAADPVPVPARHHGDMLDLVRAHTAAALGYSVAEAITADTEFAALGLDSLTLLELRNRLSTAIGRDLSLLAILDHATPQLLARHLRSELDRGEQG